MKPTPEKIRCILKRKSLLPVLFLILLNASPPSSFGQFKHTRIRSNLVFTGKTSYGFLIPHHIEMEIFNAHFTAYEIAVSKATFGKTRWEYMYNYPVIGVGYWYSGLGGSPYLGAAHAVMPFIEFPVSENRGSRLFIRTALGIGYLTEHFDRTGNYKNVAIGSAWNAAVGLHLQYTRKLSDRFLVSAGIGLNHFSNGSMKTPNYGLNIPNIFVSASYRLTKENPYFNKKLLPALKPFYFDGKKKVELNVAGGIGYKNMEAETGGKFIALDLFTHLLKPVSYKSKIGIGLDASFDGTDEMLVRQKYDEKVRKKIHLVKTGVEAAYELNMSRISFMGNLGYYLSGQYKGDGRIYEKIGILFRFSRSMFVHLTLKAHAGRADFLIAGLGYKFDLIYY
ncbi:MAG: acyloxyacyl hydrolase [Bacteroidales bacterium]